MVIMRMRYHHRVNDGDILDLAGRWCVAFWAEKVEEDAQPAGKLDVVACMAEPGRAEGFSVACGEEGGRSDGDGGWCGVGCVCSVAPAMSCLIRSVNATMSFSERLT